MTRIVFRFKQCNTSPVFLLAAAYFVSYITRNSLSVAMAAIIDRADVSQSVLSLAVTGSLIAYGAGQIISGVFGDRIQPRLLVFSGLCVSSIINFTVLFCMQSPGILTAMWCTNGLAQAFMWPPIVRIMVSTLSSKKYKRATVVVTWGGSFGNIALYLTAPLLITLCSWQSVFVFSGICGVIMAAIWIIRCPDVPDFPSIDQNSEESTYTVKNAFLMPVIWLIMAAIIVQGALRDGVTAWTPVFISETCNLKDTSSILTGTALPIFSIISIRLASLLYEKVLKNPLTCSLLMFLLSGVCAFVLYVISPLKTAFASAAMCTLVTGCMHGINLILIGMVPAHFKKYGHISLISGTLNACTYIGSGISTWGFSAIAEKSGWGATAGMWTVLSIIGAVICAVCVPLWHSFAKK